MASVVTCAAWSPALDARLDAVQRLAARVLGEEPGDLSLARDLEDTAQVVVAQPEQQNNQQMETPLESKY